MHKLDQMMPNERLQAFMTGKEMDRILVMPILVSITHRVVGMTHKEKFSRKWGSCNMYISCASGCDITQNVPVENIDAFMEAARKYGKYPLDKELLGIEN